ncbi:MAG: thioesterase family protein [Deltaproteobacteria bacterium]|nr:MAG: thioesterase family protein [Deltaproteobacteria bacterium]
MTFDAFFHRDGGRYVPTELTRGPWSADAQHGGPPAALLGTVLEATEQRGDSMIVRATFEMLKPVPLAPLTVATRVLNAGRSVQVLGGTISAGSEEILRGEALRIRTTDLSFPEPPLLPAVPGPDRGKVARFFPTGYEVGYHTGMENSFVRGGFLEQGPAIAWLRMRHPLIAGEPVTPLARVLIAADSGNGVSSALDYRRFIFINPDLTVYLHRYPEGEWVCLEAVTTASNRGLGLAHSVVHDVRGPIGYGLQGLLIGERKR